MHFLPSKQFITAVGALALAAVVVAGAYIIASPNTDKKVVRSGNLTPVGRVVVDTSSHPAQQDQDGDGHADWQKDISLLQSKQQGPVSQTDTPRTATERFAQNVFGIFFSQRAQGETVSEETQAALVDSLFEEVQPIKTQKYTAVDIQTISNPSQEQIHAYGNTLGAILVRNTTQTENELAILKRALENENPEYLKQLDFIIESYGNVISDSAEVLVPADAEDEHVAYLNALVAITNVIVKMRAAYDDPAQALGALQYYYSTIAELEAAVVHMQEYFINHNIQYAADDFGSVLFQI